MGLKDKLHRLRKDVEMPEQPDPENRIRMRALLAEVADARRNGRPLSPEATAVAEYFRGRCERGY